MIVIGGFSFFKGFMEQDDYELVVEEMKFSNGLFWLVFVILLVIEEVVVFLEVGSWVWLDNSVGKFIGVLELIQKYYYNKVYEVKNVYCIDD